MNTRLTLGDALLQLANFRKTREDMVAIINEGCEAYINSGKWKGAVVTVDFDSSAGYISLPYEVSGILCSTYDKVPVLAYSQYHSYVINGPGEFDETKKWRGQLEDMGDGFATQGDITTTGTLRIKTNAGDNGKSIRLYGLDQNGREIYDNLGAPGVTYIINSPTVDTSEQFSKVTGIEAGPMSAIRFANPWTLHVNDGDDTRIGQYYPGENRPMYRRYKTGVADKRIRLLCQRRFLMLRNDTDWVIPGNINALRCWVWAFDFQNASDTAQYEISFNQGLKWLNQEAKSSRGGVIPDSSFINWGTMGGCGGYYGGGSFGFGGMVTV